jgi:polyribonucleotide nucleotidyltransferase
VSDYLSEGQDVQVKVLDVDQRGRIKLSMREVADESGSSEEGGSNDAPEEESLVEE